MTDFHILVICIVVVLLMAGYLKLVEKVR